MNHFMFEFGVATAILGKGFGKIVINDDDIAALKKDGYEKTFYTLMKQVVDLATYETYAKTGWNQKLAKTVRMQLVPLIVKGVVLGWYQSILLNGSKDARKESHTR